VQDQWRFGCGEMQNFLTGDDRRAQRPLRSSARSSGVVPICPDAQTTPTTARPQEDVSHQAENGLRPIKVIATQYFCSIAAQFLKNSNRVCKLNEALATEK
jgi:hypothetical protein